MNPYVSIIIPCYNQQEYLKECVEHAAAQTYKEVEILLIDDGSTDGTPEQCDRYAEKYENVKVIHKENGGLSSARNCGLEHANGQWILFCDCDDFLHRDAVKELVETVSKLEKCDFIFFDAVTFRGQVSEETISREYMREICYCGVRDGVEVLGELFERNEVRVAAWLNMYHKDFLDAYCIRFYNGILHEDLLFSFYIYMQAKYVARMKKNYYYRRVHEGTITTSPISMKRYDGVCISCTQVGSYIRDTQMSKLQKKIAWKYFLMIYNSLNHFYETLRANDIDITARHFQEIDRIVRERYYGCFSLKNAWICSRTRVYWKRVKNMLRGRINEWKKN